MRYIAFLSGINVGKRRISMANLASIFVELGFSEVRTHLASDNVSFDSGTEPSIVEIEARFRLTFDFDTSVALYGIDEVNTLLDQVSTSLKGELETCYRPLADPKSDLYRYVVALSNGEHELKHASKVARVDLIGSYRRGSLWRWTIEDGRPPASMAKLFTAPTTTRFAHTLEKIYRASL